MKQKHLFAAVVAWLIAAATASAHWVWIVPEKDAARQAQLFFAHGLEPEDKASLMERIAEAKVWARDGDADKALEPAKKKTFYQLTLPKNVTTTGGINTYGVVAKGKDKPFLLIQCPKLVIGSDPRPWARLPLEMAPMRDGDAVRVQVFFEGKPAPAGLKISVHGDDDKKELTTDAKGIVTLKPGAGLVALTVPHTVATAGEHGGKKYEVTRYSASLVLAPAEGKVNGTRQPGTNDKSEAVVKAEPAEAGKPDPEAVKLFEEARLAGRTGRISPASAPTSPCRSMAEAARAASLLARTTSSKSKDSARIARSSSAVSWARSSGIARTRAARRRRRAFSTPPPATAHWARPSASSATSSTRPTASATNNSPSCSEPCPRSVSASSPWRT